MVHFVLHFDGSCWPNPGGTAAWGFVLKEYNRADALPRPITKGSGVTGTNPVMSNNVAEFDALYYGLSALSAHLLERGESGSVEPDTLTVYGDSQLVVNMMSGIWSPKKDKLYYPFWQKAFDEHAVLEVLKGLPIEYKWIPREQNIECDILSKEHNNAPK